MKTEEKKPSYTLVILRRDGEHIFVLDSDNYDKIFEAYKEITTRWSSCIKDNSPFFLEKPIVTTFDPGLIYEITIKPIVETVAANRYDNPYAQAMHKNGLSQMPSILDGGYR